MAYVVTKACIGTKDRSCVEVCPVDCFYDIQDPALNDKYGVEWADEDAAHSNKRNAGMLMIHPDECINCGACEPECPVGAIFEDSGVSADLEEFVKLNEEVTLGMGDSELDSARCTSRD